MVFSFRSTHYAVAWVAIGALVLHVAVKLPVIRRALLADVEDEASTGRPSRASRRSVSARAAARDLGGGRGGRRRDGREHRRWLRDVSVLAVRSGEGPQGVPINKSAVAARVTDLARDPAYRLRWRTAAGSVEPTRDELLALEQAAEELPIACVEGWSASGTWTGVRVRDLLALVGAPADSDVAGDVAAAERPVPRDDAARELRVRRPHPARPRRSAGEPLAIDHGYPCRIIAPNRPGVLQTKWVSRLEVLT